MVAMGTHGYGGMMSLLVGSVSAEVIRKVGRPVLVVHDADEQAASPPSPTASEATG
jgi:nucleotide-binding universal stress UspA family protein